MGLLIPAALLCLANEIPPQKALNRDWLITSLLKGSELANKNLFDITFEKGPGSKTKRIWVASSNGLHSFDVYSWRRYGKRQGLPSDFVRSVLITRSGQLWVGTDQGAGTFDGRTFSSHGSERGLAGVNVRRIVEDRDGTLWFCSDTWPRASGQGGLTSYHDGQWHAWHTSDGLPSEYVVNYFQDSKGEQLVVTLAGVAQLRGQKWTPLLTGLVPRGVNWGSGSIAETPQAGLVISTGSDVFVRKLGKWRAFSGLTKHEHGITATRDGRIVACARIGPNRRAFMEWTGVSWKPASAEFPITHDYVEEVQEDPEGSIYAIGFDCLQKWQRQPSEWVEYLGVPRPRLADTVGEIWLMDERGLGRQMNGHWQMLGTSYKALVGSPNGSVWAWNDHLLTCWRGNQQTRFGAAETGIRQYLSVDIDRRGHLWVFGRDDQEHQHLKVFDGEGWEEKEIPQSTSLLGAPDPVSGMWYLAQSTQSSGSALLIHVDKRIHSYTIPPARLSQFTNDIHADQNGNVWLIGETGLHRWGPKNGGGWETISDLHGSSVIACLERTGELWFAMDGTTGGKSGLMRVSHGERRTFDTDPILSWSKADDGTLLFGSKGKFYVIPVGGDKNPIPVNLPEDDQVISILKAQNQTYWLGISKGVLLFHPDNIPPETRFLTFDKQVLRGQEYRARAQGFERFNPSGTSLSFAYSWSMDGGGWTPFARGGERSFSADRLALGMHRLQVRSRDNAMDVDPAPVEIAFQVHDLPIQERDWFLPLATITGLLLVSLTVAAGSARRKLTLQARILEQAVEARTAELVADIARREQVEKKLRVSEERRRLALEAGGMGTWVWDRSLAELSLDDRCQALLGVSSPTLAYHKLLRTIYSSDRKRANTALSRALENDTGCDVQFRVRLPNGSLRWIRAKGCAERDEQGPNMRIVGIAVDVTEVTQHQEEMRRANRVLQRANNDLRQFAWAVSHDLQEPLRMVVSYTQFLAKVYKDRLDEKGKQYISFAVTGATRMQTLLQALVEYWQVDEPRERPSEPVDAASALQKALGNLETAIAESGAIVSHSALPKVLVSETALMQVFQNLIGNAIKYRKPNERPGIHVGAERTEESEWVFSVHDNGIGIAPEHQKLVFGVFKRLNGNKHPGAGIGLAICVKVVEHMGGKLWVESEVGQGSTFHFTIPVGKSSEWNIPAAVNARS